MNGVRNRCAAGGQKPYEATRRVLSIPGRHPYVDRCLGENSTVGGSPTVVPSPALTPDWVRRHGHEFDVVHLHFGFEHLTLPETDAWLDTLRRLGLPLVYTVHDLRNPHLTDNTHHERQLDRLITSAAAVLTLTPGAAAQIHGRWGRRPVVVPHPYVVEPAQRPPRSAPGGRVGIHFKDLRRNVIGPGLIVEVVARAARAAGGRLRVDVHPATLDRPELRPVRAAAARREIDLRVHPRFDDRELAEYLAGLDVAVLPYRFGTHSGWLEACRDVGTRVVAPASGHYRDQWDDVVGYRCHERGDLDRAGLADAVHQALRRPPAPRISTGARVRQLAAVRATYARVVDAVIRDAGRTMPAAGPATEKGA